MSNKIENLKSIVDKLNGLYEEINNLLDEDEKGYDKGGYLSGASGYINQAIDCIEVYVIPRVEQEEAEALKELVDMAKADIENGRVKPASSVIKELREKYK